MFIVYLFRVGADPGTGEIQRVWVTVVDLG